MYNCVYIPFIISSLSQLVNINLYIYIVICPIKLYIPISSPRVN